MYIKLESLVKFSTIRLEPNYKENHFLPENTKKRPMYKIFSLYVNPWQRLGLQLVVNIIVAKLVETGPEMPPFIKK